jgi:hypothetical protein
VYGEDAIEVSSVWRWVNRFRRHWWQAPQRLTDLSRLRPLRPKIRLMRWYGMIFTSQKMDFAPQWGLENWQFWQSSEVLVTENTAQTGHRKCSPSNKILLQRTEKDGDVFLLRIITGYETWVHRCNPLTKRWSREWRYQSSPLKKQFKVQIAAEKSHG